MTAISLRHPSASQALTITPAALAWFWGAIILVNGVLYKTYDIAVPNMHAEAARQLGLTFLAFEVVVIAYAIRAGLELREYWVRTPRLSRALIGVFLGTFWVSSVFVSPLFPTSLILCLSLVVQVLFAISLHHCLPALSRTDIRAVPVIVLTFALFGVLTFVRIAHPTPEDFSAATAVGWQFSIPGFISVRLFGAVAGAFLTLFIAMALLVRKNQGERIWIYGGLILLATFTLWTATRAAIVGASIAIVFILVAYRIRPPLSAIVASVICIAIGAVIAPQLVPYGDPVFMLYDPRDGASADALSGGRFSLWQATWEAYLHHPLFGAGSAANQWALPKAFFPHVQPHNVVLQLLINWGLPAAISGLALLAIVTIKAHMVAARARHVLPVLAMLDALLTMSLFDGIFHFAGETMLVMICFAIIFKADKTARL